MAQPMTSDQLVAAGYHYDGDGTCRGCQAPIEWWITPGGKKMPMTVIAASDRSKSIKAMMKDSGDLRQSHFADCPEATKFRR
jgi:anti-sigma factor RsiW